MSRELAIGIVCFPGFGGSGVVASELAHGLAQHGHRVHLFATARPGRPGASADGVQLHTVSVSEYPLFEYPPYEWAVTAELVESAHAHRLDLVQVHYAVPHAASAYLARQILAAQAPKFVTTLHGTDVTRVGGERNYTAVTRFTVAASDGISVPSEFLRQEACRRLALDENDIEVIPNFVDTETFMPAERDPGFFDRLFPAYGESGAATLLHVSNFRPVKRTRDLVEVLARVRRELPARLVLIGDGPERPHTEQRAAELDVTGSMLFLGQSRDLAGYLRQADALLLPSESESFGLAALEAMSSGVPVFGYRVGGLPEVVTPETGCLVEPFDVDALARAVVEVVGDRRRQLRMAQAGRARALRHFQRGPAIARYEEYFRTLVG